jgi:small-conductance mechanosensitive channel
LGAPFWIDAMIRLLVLLLVALALGPHPAAAEAPAPPPPAITADQAKAALEVLNDPQKRAAFEATLQAIVRAQPANRAADGSLDPSSLGAQILLRVDTSMTHLRQKFATAVDSAERLPLLWAWVVVMATNPLGQAIMVAVGWRLLLAVAAAAAAGWFVQRILRRPAARLEKAALALTPPPEDPEDRAEQGNIEPDPEAEGPVASAARKPMLALGRFGLRLLPVLALLTAGHVVALAVGGPRASALVTEAVLQAAALILFVVEAVRILLAPHEPRLRLIALNDSRAVYLTRWSQRLAATGIAGYAIAEVGVLLGLSAPGHDAVLGTTFLLLTLGLATVVVSQRRRVRRALRVPADATGIRARFRNGLAKIWHWLALLVLAIPWLGWALDISVSGGAAFRTIGLLVLVPVAAKLVLLVLLRLIDWLPVFGSRASEHFPGLEDRVRFYHPALAAGVRGTVYLVAVLALLQVLGSDSMAWLWSTQAGQRLLASLATLAITILASVLVWELVNAAIQRHLDRLLRDAQLARSARLRTLLPMLRTTLLIAVGVVTVLMVLSEIGVNIAPLLAGAGILGVAIGFGSQKLVQDLITGVFLLLENAIQVGDWVNAAGLAGRVEGLSIRTIRLRATDGALHIVPFSSVGSVTNSTRGIGNADVRATVEFGVDTDAVAEIMAAVVAEMRTDPDFGAKIAHDFQLFGVDKIDANGVTITGQVACTDSGRWSVQREINRRIKHRFDAAGIRFFSQVAPVPLIG